MFTRPKGLEIDYSLYRPGRDSGVGKNKQKMHIHLIGPTLTLQQLADANNACLCRLSAAVPLLMRAGPS